MKSPRGWQRKFDDPIPLPRGRQLVTLEDAGTYITKLLPKAEHEVPQWQDAMEALILVATRGGAPRCWRASASCERCTGTRSGCLIQIARIRIGENGSWRAIGEAAFGRSFCLEVRLYASDDGEAFNCRSACVPTW
jgi:hypothetical protein